MTTVRIAHAEPRPGKLSNGEFQTLGHLVVLADSSSAAAGSKCAARNWFVAPATSNR
jgi:hypothetical protein